MRFVNPARRTRVAEVVAVAARDPSVPAPAARYGIPNVVADYDACSRVPMSTRSTTRRRTRTMRPTIRARAGKHVLCEKPLAASAAEARSMAAAARQHRVRSWRRSTIAITRLRTAPRHRAERGDRRLRHVEARFIIPIVQRETSAGGVISPGRSGRRLLHHEHGAARGRRRAR
jgi:hypothetical protein